MKASQLYIGEYYAWTSHPTKGRITLNAKKVYLKSTETHKGRFDTNAKTHAVIRIVDSNQEKRVRAREIVDFWDSYQDEMNVIKQEEIEQKAEQHRSNVRNAMVASMVSHKMGKSLGKDLTGQLFYDSYSQCIRIPIRPMLSLLGISESQIEIAVDKHIEGEAV